MSSLSSVRKPGDTSRNTYYKVNYYRRTYNDHEDEVGNGLLSHDFDQLSGLEADTHFTEQLAGQIVIAYLYQRPIEKYFADSYRFYAAYPPQRAISRRARRLSNLQPGQRRHLLLFTSADECLIWEINENDIRSNWTLKSASIVNRAKSEKPMRMIPARIGFFEICVHRELQPVEGTWRGINVRYRLKIDSCLSG